MFSKSLTTLAIALLAASQLISAQPHGRRHNRNRRDAANKVVTVNGPTVTKYVDEKGNQLDGPNAPVVIVTVTPGYGAPAPAPPAPTYAPPPAPPKEEPKAPDADKPAPKPSTTAPAPPPPSSSAAPSSAAPSSAAPSSAAPSSAAPSSAAPSPSEAPKPPSSNGNAPGIVYSPYYPNGASGTGSRKCRDKAKQLSDYKLLKDFSLVRLYDIDCDQVATGIEASKQYGFKLFVGLFDINKINEQIPLLSKQVGNDWDRIHTVSIGNEVVLDAASKPDVAGKFASQISSAKEQLKKAGYSGSVVGVDTWVALVKNKAICEASDYVAANAHAYFDGNVGPSDSGKFLQETVIPELKKACPGKEIMITETGWPNNGAKPISDKARYGASEQKQAIESIKGSLGSKAILFTAFDDQWKTDNAATGGSEKHWGIFPDSY